MASLATIETALPNSTHTKPVEAASNRNSFNCHSGVSGAWYDGSDINAETGKYPIVELENGREQVVTIVVLCRMHNVKGLVF